MTNSILNLKEVTLFIHLGFNALLISYCILFPFFILLRIFILAYLVIIILQNISHRGCWRKYKFSWTWIYLACLRIVRVSCQKWCIIFHSLDDKLFQILGRDSLKMTWFILFILTTILTNIGCLIFLFILTLLIYW